MMKLEEAGNGVQVVCRRPIMGHGNMNEVRVGTIIAKRETAQGTLVKVRFPGTFIQTEVTLEQLEPVSSAFGRARVQLNPANRAVDFVRK